jgi:hypothetical protein
MASDPLKWKVPGTVTDERVEMTLKRSGRQHHRTCMYVSVCVGQAVTVHRDRTILSCRIGRVLAQVVSVLRVCVVSVFDF